MRKNRHRSRQEISLRDVFDRLLEKVEIRATATSQYDIGTIDRRLAVIESKALSGDEEALREKEFLLQERQKLQ